MTLNIAEAISGLAAIITAIILLARALKTTPNEVRSTDADVVGKYERVATSAAARAQHLETRMDAMEEKYQAEIKVLRERIVILENINREKDQSIDDLRDLLEETKNELEIAVKTRQDREARILELERKVSELEGKI